MNSFLNTSIPSHARGKVRAFVKSHSMWDAHCAANKIESRKATNRQLLEFAKLHGEEGAVLKLIGLPVSGGYAVSLQPEIITEAQFAEIEASEEEIIMSDEAHAAWGAEISRVEDLLSPVEQFLSPFVKAKLEDVLNPLIEAANRPAEVREVIKEVIVEKVVHVTSPALPEAPRGALPYAVKSGTIKLGKLFGFTGEHANGEVTMWDSFGAAPAVDPHYVVDPFNMRMLATAFERGSNVWLGGPGGSGKSSLPEQFCAFTGRPFVKLSFTRQSNVEDMLGGTGIKGGDSAWEDGVLIQNIRRPGTVVLLDELTLSPAGVQGLFQGLCDDHRTIFLPTGEKVTCAPGVVFCVADNTFGNGDETGLYAGTNQSNAALVNRFKRMLRIGYMSRDQEAKALANRTEAPLSACEHVADFMVRARKMPEMENVVLSLRNMVGLVQAVQDGFTPKQAAQVTFLNQLPSTERAALEALFTLVWEKEFERLLHGGAPLVDLAGPADTAAAFAFDDEVSASFTR